MLRTMGHSEINRFAPAHCLHTAGVAGSIPAAPTILSNTYGDKSDRHAVPPGAIEPGTDHRASPANPSVQWRPVPGFEAYHVSNRGDVRRVVPASRGRSAGKCPYPIAIQKIGRAGKYRGVTLTRWDGTQERIAVHQLVCRAFNGRPPNGKTEVNHINGVHDDNRPENLEWCTRSENERHKVALRFAHMSAGNGISATGTVVSGGRQMEGQNDG